MRPFRLAALIVSAAALVGAAEAQSQEQKKPSILAKREKQFPVPSSWIIKSFNGKAYVNNVAPNVNFNLQHLGLTGGSQPHNNMMPYLVLNYVIALQGIYPPRT